MKSFRQPPTATRIREENSDVLGIGCALICLLHCWSLPVLGLLSPTVDFLNIFTSPVAHQVLFCVTLFAAVKAIGPELKQHRDPMIALSMGLGLTLLFLEAFMISSWNKQPSTPLAVGELDKLLNQPQLAGSMLPIHDWILPIAVTSNETIIALSQFLHPWLNPCGGCLLIVAHLINLRKRQERYRALKNNSCNCHQ